MNQYSLMVGSFVRTGNYPMEANYIFETYEDLVNFYSDELLKATLHEGLLKLVKDNGDGNQALCWVTNSNGELVFDELVADEDIDNILKEVDNINKKLEDEIKERKAEDITILGANDRTEIPEDLSNILNLANALVAFKEEYKKTTDQIREDVTNIYTILKFISGTEEDNIITYLNSLDYKNLTELSKTLNKFLNTFDSSDNNINTLPEIQEFLHGFTDLDKLYNILVDLLTAILGTPTPNTQFRTLRGIQDFVLALESSSKNRMDNIQSELDQTQIGVGLSGDGSYNADNETYYLRNATSVMNALKILDSLINLAINNCNIQPKDTESVEVAITKESDKTTISAKVKVSPEPGNDIITKLDGIYHNIDSEYVNGVLTIKVNGNIRQQHNLGLSTIVNEAYYDTTSESIVIVFRLHDGEKQTINIPVSNLILEWQVDNSKSGKVVELEKERIIDGSDKLSADVRISTNKYNILEKENNTLLVRGTSDNIIYEGDVTVKSKLDSLSGNNAGLDNSISELSQGLAEEISRAKNAEHILLDGIDSEKIRAEKEELNLKHLLDNETTRALDSETLLDHKIKDVKDSLDSLSLRVDTLSSDLNSEINRAKSEENKLSNNIENVGDNLLEEIARSTSKDLEIAKEISDIINKCIVSGATTADAARTKLAVLGSGYSTLEEVATTLKSFLEDTDTLNTAINKWSEIELFLNGITDLLTLLDLLTNIQSNLTTSIDNLRTNLTSETNRAILAEDKIAKEVSDLISNCVVHGTSTSALAALELAKLGDGFSSIQEIGLTLRAFLINTDTADSTINKWKEVEQFLSGITDLETLTGLLENIQSNLNLEILLINLKVADEVTRAKIAEQSLLNSITLLTANVETKDLDLENRINTEKTRAIDAEALLDHKIDDVNLRIITIKENVENNINVSISSLQDTLNQEISRSTQEDADTRTILSDLSTKISNEATRAKAEESVIRNELNSEKERAVLKEDFIDSRITDHILDHNNPHMVTADQINAYTKDKVNDLLQSVDIRHEVITDKLNDSLVELKLDFGEHLIDYSNPHKVTKEQIGLSKVDNTTDLEKPISLALQEAFHNIDLLFTTKADLHDFNAHIFDHNNPHNVTKELLSLGNVDNTSDIIKPISIPTLMALDKKSDIGHTHIMSDIGDLEMLPIIKGFAEILGELPEDPANGDKYILVTLSQPGVYKYTLCEYEASRGWVQKLLTTGGVATVIDGDVWKLNSSGPERMMDVSDYSYFYNKIYDETKDLIEDIDWEEDDANADTNNLIRLKITYKKAYGDPNESEVENPYQEKPVKYIDIEKARFLSDFFSRPATLVDVDNGYATKVGEPMLVLILTTGNYVAISLKDALNIYDAIDTSSIDMEVTDWTGNPDNSYKVSAVVRLAQNEDKKSAVSLHILNNTEKGMYATLHTSNTNSISLNPSTGTDGTQKTLSANLNIDNEINNNSNIVLKVSSNGLSAEFVWGEYD